MQGGGWKPKVQLQDQIKSGRLKKFLIFLHITNLLVAFGTKLFFREEMIPFERSSKSKIK